jgi:hypothetical protein
MYGVSLEVLYSTCLLLAMFVINNNSRCVINLMQYMYIHGVLMMAVALLAQLVRACH